MTVAWHNTQTDSNVEVCALRYCHQESIKPITGPIVLLAAKNVAGLKLYAHRTLMQQILDKDQEYIENLLKDLLERAKAFPDEVFKQLSGLSVGPLITDAIVPLQLHESTIEEIYPDFSLWDE